MRGGGGQGAKRAEKNNEVEVSLMLMNTSVLHKSGIRHVFTKPLDQFVAAWQ